VCNELTEPFSHTVWKSWKLNTIFKINHSVCSVYSSSFFKYAILFIMQCKDDWETYKQSSKSWWIVFETQIVTAFLKEKTKIGYYFCFTPDFFHSLDFTLNKFSQLVCYQITLFYWFNLYSIIFNYFIFILFMFYFTSNLVVKAKNKNVVLSYKIFPILF